MPRKKSLVDMHEEELYTRGRDGRRPFVYSHDVVEGGAKSLKRLMYGVVALVLSSFAKNIYDSQWGTIAKIEAEASAARRASIVAAHATDELQKAVDETQDQVQETQNKIDEHVLPAVRAARENSKKAAANTVKQPPKKGLFQ